MQLNSIHILNYKNIAEATLEFSDDINCFIGDNGMGKTNLLDAIYYLSFCKSFSNAIDSQNIMHEAEFFMIQGKYLVNNTHEELYCGMKRKQKKIITRNKLAYERLSDHIGLLPLVLISPDDQILISEGSEERRKFIDAAISQYNNQYLQQLLQYNQALKQRNALLKLDTHPDPTLFDLWEEQMLELGEKIHRQRKLFLADFIPMFDEVYAQTTGGHEEIQLLYRSQFDSPEVAKHMHESRFKDKILGFSTVGTHKDDLEMLLNNYPIKRIGSQGQNKSFLVALKLAQHIFLTRQHNSPPLLLLDDIFDKLDAKRVEKIIRFVSGDNFGQIFITDTNREHLDTILLQFNKNTRIFTVSNGIFA